MNIILDTDALKEEFTELEKTYRKRIKDNNRTADELFSEIGLFHLPDIAGIIFYTDKGTPGILNVIFDTVGNRVSLQGTLKYTDVKKLARAIDKKIDELTK